MKNNLPNLIIAGVHKAATTSLYTYLASHPDIYGSGKKEIHFFTPIRFGKQTKDISIYEKYFEARKNEKYAIDASPSYVYGGKHLMDKMIEILPPHKIIVILREPVARFISNYNYLKSKLFIPADEELEVFIQKCLSATEQPLIDNDYNRAVIEGKYIDFIPLWMDFYKNDMKIIYFEELVAQPRNIMIEIANWLEISEEPFSKMNYTAENKTVFVKNKAMHSLALFFNHKFEIFFRKNHKIKTKLRDIYYWINQQKQNNNIENDKNKLLLHSIYKESNVRLASYLKSKNMHLPLWLKNGL